MPWVDPAGPAVPIPANGSIARLALAPAVWRLARRWPVRRRLDVVHVHEPFAPLLGLAMTARSRAPLVGTFHTYATNGMVQRTSVKGISLHGRARFD